MAGVIPYCRSKTTGTEDIYRRRSSWKRLPDNWKDLSPSVLYDRIFNNLHSFLFYAHNLQVPDVVLRKVFYDCLHDALMNLNGRYVYPHFEQEYQKFKAYFDENFRGRVDIADWERYRASQEYKTLLQEVKKIPHPYRRIQVLVNNGMAYLYAKYQKPYTPGAVLTQIEKALKLDLLPRLWGKWWLWVLLQTLVFDASKLYAHTIAEQKYDILQFDPTADAIKVRVTRWWERKDIDAPKEFQTFARIYENVLIPVVSELGSALLAEAALAGVSMALIHITRSLTTIATFHPYLRAATVGAMAAYMAFEVLNRTVLGWLGWQVAVEWTLDGYIQSLMHEGLKWAYAKWKGINPAILTKWGYWSYLTAIKGLIAAFETGQISQTTQALLDYAYSIATPKGREILDRLRVALIKWFYVNAAKTYWRTIPFTTGYSESRAAFDVVDKNILERPAALASRIAWYEQNRIKLVTLPMFERMQALYNTEPRTYTRRKLYNLINLLDRLRQEAYIPTAPYSPSRYGYRTVFHTREARNWVEHTLDIETRFPSFHLSLVPDVAEWIINEQEYTISENEEYEYVFRVWRMPLTTLVVRVNGTFKFEDTTFDVGWSIFTDSWKKVFAAFEDKHGWPLQDLLDPRALLYTITHYSHVETPAPTAKILTAVSRVGAPLRPRKQNAYVSIVANRTVRSYKTVMRDAFYYLPRPVDVFITVSKYHSAGIYHFDLTRFSIPDSDIDAIAYGHEDMFTAEKDYQLRVRLIHESQDSPTVIYAAQITRYSERVHRLVGGGFVYNDDWMPNRRLIHYRDIRPALDVLPTTLIILNSDRSSRARRYMSLTYDQQRSTYTWTERPAPLKRAKIIAIRHL